MKECPRCGSVMFRVMHWDGVRSGGHRTTCAFCGTVIESTEYYAKSPDIYVVKE